MKLLEIKSDTNRRRLPSYDIYAPVRESAAIAEALSELQEAGQDIYQAWEERQIRSDLDEADLEFQRKQNNFIIEHAKKQTYSADELPDGVTVPRSEIIVDEYGNKIEIPRDNIPSYEVYPQLYKRHTEALIESLAPRIRSSRAREIWVSEKRKAANKKYTDVALDAVANQRTSIDERQERNVREAMDAGRWSLARQLVRNSSLDSLKKQVLRDAINIREETSRYQMYMARDDIAGMNQAIEFLKSEKYYDEGGTLTHTDRLNFISAMESEISSIRSATDARMGAEYKLLEDEVREIITSLEQGIKINPDYITTIVAKLDPQRSPVLARDLAVAVIHQHRFSRFAKMNIANRESYLKKMKQEKPTAIDAKLYRMLQSAHVRLSEIQRNDTMRLGLNSGIIRPEEFVPLDFRNLSRSLEGRIPLLERLVMQYGSVNGILTKDEALELANRINSANVPQKIAIAGEIYKGLGDRSSVIFEQLRTEGLTGSFPVAAQAAADGYPADARLMFEGAGLIDADPTLLKEVKPDLDEYWLETMGRAYVNDRTMRTMVKQAYYGAFVMLAEDLTSFSGEDEAVRERALRMATGGIVVDSTGNYLSPPSRYFGQENWDDYVESLHYTALKEMGNPENMTHKELKQAIDRGRVSFHSVGKNEYGLTLNNQPIKDSNTGEIFIFKYIKDAMTKERWKELWEIDGRKKGKNVPKETQTEWPYYFPMP